MTDVFCDYDDMNSCNDASSICSMDMAEMMKGFTAGRPYESAKQEQAPAPQPPTTITSIAIVKKDEAKKNNSGGAGGGYDADELNDNNNSGGSWEFDLGPLKLELEKAHEKSYGNQRVTTPRKEYAAKSMVSSKTCSTAGETASRMTGGSPVESDVEEDLSFDGEASMALGQIMGPGAHLHGNNMKKPMNPHQSIMSSCDNFFYQDSVCSEAMTVGGSAAANRLEERRAARAARMEKVRQRIAREKEQARQKEQAEQWQSEIAQNTPEAKRQRAYEWYCRLGMPPRKELKKRIKTMPSSKLTPDDIDLLPWTITGGTVNVSRLSKMGVNVRPGSIRSK